MTVAEHIQQHLRVRLDDCECLVVYDPDGRYRDLTLALADDRTTVVDGAQSTIAGREQATTAWRALTRAQPGDRSLLVYLPVPKPESDRNRERDPYAALAAGGGVFPSSDSDRYLELALAAKPTHADAVRALFADGSAPDLATLDAVDAGRGYPRLRALLGAESPREIALGLLAPADAQRDELEKDTAWAPEYRQFAQAELGLDANARLRALDSIQVELARYLLFSEFAFDLPEALPPALASVSHADAARRTLVFAVCDALRVAAPEAYVALARQVETDLDLDALAGRLGRLGERDTFAFEERAYLRRVAALVQDGDLDSASAVADGRQRSLWAQEGDRAPSWGLARRVLDLARLLRSAPDPPGGQSASALAQAYTDTLYRIDAAHRHLETAVQQAVGLADELDGAIADVRRLYRDHADARQRQLVAAVQRDGWPLDGFLRHTRVFDSLVAPHLGASARVAYLLVDAFRYELAAEFAGHLRDTPAAETVELQAVAAALPTVTPVGMAALLPGADGQFKLDVQADKVVPMIGEDRVRTREERLALVQRLYGDRAHDMTLDDLFKPAKRKLAPTVQLLVVTTTEIDTTGETNPEALGRTFLAVQQKLTRALRILQDLGFSHVVVATDHGFLWLPDERPGDKLHKPDGDWTMDKERALLGSARSTATGTVALGATAVGIRTPTETLAVPESLGSYVSGKPYRHSGLSLQEAVLPVVSVRLASAAPASAAATVHLGYRGGRTDVVTTRLPLVELGATSELFGPDVVEVRLDVVAGGASVGEPSPSAYTDPATGLVRVGSGDTVKVPLRLRNDFEGTFTVRATDPNTGMTFAELTLQTDYVD